MVCPDTDSEADTEDYFDLYCNVYEIYMTIFKVEKECQSEETKLGFNPKKLSHILLLKRKLNAALRKMDMECIIKICVERGENLDYIRVMSKPGLIHLLDLYNDRYDLVSNDNNSKSAITLSRILRCFPEFACWYVVNCAKTPVVSFERMNEICNGYPKVMMTPAFAFLIPNTNEMYCQLLRKAHLLHHQEYRLLHLNFRTMTRPDRAYATAGNMNLSIKETEAAITESHIPRKTQLKLLEQYNVISITDTGIIVPEVVIRAAKMWDEKLEKFRREIYQQISEMRLKIKI